MALSASSKLPVALAAAVAAAAAAGAPRGGSLRGAAGSGDQQRLDYINGCWRGTASGQVSTTDLCQAGVLMHDGLFSDAGGKPTWDPRVCAGTFAESPCKDAAAWPGHINRWSLVQSSLVSAARPKVYVPDPQSIGNAVTPDNINVGIIIDASVTSFMCAYQNDVSSNTWTAVCPKTLTFPKTPSSAVLCGTCRTDCPLTDGDCGCSDQPVSCPADVLMYSGGENNNFPYNEVEVQASLVGPEAILALYLTATSNADDEGLAFSLQKELDVPVLRYNADSGFSLAQPGAGPAGGCADCDCGWATAGCGPDDSTKCWGCCCSASPAGGCADCDCGWATAGCGPDDGTKCWGCCCAR